MTLQEKTKQKAEGFGKLAPVFLEGAKFALSNQWISIDEDLPCNHEKLMAKRLFSYEKETVKVLTLYIDGEVMLDFMVHYRGKWKWWSNKRPICWCLIPEPPKE